MPFEHAVVLGGSIAGLLAAAALSESFEQVTIVDRDLLAVDGPEALRSRKGVPHGDQIHHMLSLGSERIDSLLPGFDDELLEHGCQRYDPTADFAQYANGRWQLRVHSDMRITCFQRPLLEWVMRQRVFRLDNIAVHRGLAAGLLSSPDGRRVIGVTLENSSEDRLIADLVVDATGRTSSATKWLDVLGYDKPRSRCCACTWGTRRFSSSSRREPCPKDCTASSAQECEQLQGRGIRPCGDGLHIVMAGGMMRNYPPGISTA